MEGSATNTPGRSPSYDWRKHWAGCPVSCSLVSKRTREVEAPRPSGSANDLPRLLPCPNIAIGAYRSEARRVLLALVLGCRLVNRDPRWWRTSHHPRRGSGTIGAAMQLSPLRRIETQATDDD